MKLGIVPAVHALSAKACGPMDTLKVKQVMLPCRAGARMLCMPSTIQVVIRRCCFSSTKHRKRGRLELKANLVVFEAQASSQPTALLTCYFCRGLWCIASYENALFTLYLGLG